MLKRKMPKKGMKKRPKKPRTYVLKKKKCRFCADKTIKIDYLNFQLLHRFVTERGKIVPSRITGCCAKHQRKIAVAIKRARNIGILPYLAK